MSYDDDLRALAAAEGIEYIDCRVQPGWEAERPRLRVVESLPTLIPTVVPVDVPVPEPILLRSPYEQMILEPRHREAAARGLKIHEAALERADREGISYAEAIEKERP